MQGIINSLILDMDGVLWRDDEPIGNLGRIFKILVDHQYHFILATNNSTKTVDQYLEKLRRFDVYLNELDIITSAEATGKYLSEINPHGGNVYVIGDPGLIETLAKYSFYHGGDDPFAVIVGMDRYLTYDKIKKKAD